MTPIIQCVNKNHISQTGVKCPLFLLVTDIRGKSTARLR